MRSSILIRSSYKCSELKVFGKELQEVLNIQEDSEGEDEFSRLQREQEGSKKVKKALTDLRKHSETLL